MTAWAAVVGQPHAVAVLQAAVDDAAKVPPGDAMTHAWLITGPPGSGRSVAAEAFAAALICRRGGCGACHRCRDVADRAHPDAAVVTPEGLSYGADDARRLAELGAYSPTSSNWHVIVLEDADRLTESANNVLLKSIEEPPPRTVWVLCTPSAADVQATIRSRCREVRLRTPATDEVAEYLARSVGVDERTAFFAARAAQGHVGRARALAVDDTVRQQRQWLLSIPSHLAGVASGLALAAEMVERAREAATHSTASRDTAEMRDLEAAWGEGAEGKGVKGGARGIRGAVKELETRQTSRRTRTQRDEIDRMLLDLLTYYRDVLVLQTAPTPEGSVRVDLINAEIEAELGRAAAVDTEDATLLRIAATERARAALGANVAPELAIDALMMELLDPGLRGKWGLAE